MDHVPVLKMDTSCTTWNDASHPQGVAPVPGSVAGNVIATKPLSYKTPKLQQLQQISETFITSTK